MSLARDPETGHLIGIEPRPEPAAKVGIEFPKWLTPHRSHIEIGDGGHLSVAGFEHHIDRAGNLTVLVKDAAEEADALAPKSDKTRLRLVPDAPADVSAGEPLSPLWPKPDVDAIQANIAAAAATEEAPAAEPAPAAAPDPIVE